MDIIYCKVCGKYIDSREGEVCCECKYNGFSDEKPNYFESDFTYGDKNVLFNNIDNVLESKRNNQKF